MYTAVYTTAYFVLGCDWMWAALMTKLLWRQVLSTLEELCIRFKTDTCLSNILLKQLLATPGVGEKAAEKLKKSTRMLLDMTLVFPT